MNSPSTLRRPIALQWILSLSLSISASALLAACGGSSSNTEEAAASSKPQVFEQSTAPKKLSEWRLLINDGKTLSLNAGLVPYDLNSALFSDYSSKLRSIYVPPGKQIAYKADGTLEFPIGSVITKTFYYPKATPSDAANLGVAKQSGKAQGSSLDLASNVLIETRILVLQPDGTWSGLPYVWDADQKDAQLKVGGKDVAMELVSAGAPNQKFTYSVPTAQSCQQCHSTATAGGAGILPIGPKARNLNKSYEYSAGVSKNQLVNLDELKLLSGFTGLAAAPVNADWRDSGQTLEARAKAYLDVNCAHCHSSRGAAFQSGLMLDFNSVGQTTASTVQWGVCKKPLAYGGPGAPYLYGIEPGQADVSLLLYRMSHTTTGDVMPAIGRHLNHEEANSVVKDWINSLKLPACL
ncbi:SO2930 family diheme c-type cytochrome [Paucibacter sp. Y2R2-4]|uniref:SO2930 family diheme c-type cytochrome n=1 Tax=Paucibacter sp. Y2R2-4 TaxID=2893553 RepID=UPI0021E3BDE4|nr:SO2930 family diheme c-type cytochrome [Paucibacter sp. Y2R2-4]MCV2352470.1 hypothetical protein [Paucibacter sp. Y2R2-4]